MTDNISIVYVFIKYIYIIILFFLLESKNTSRAIAAHALPQLFPDLILIFKKLQKYIYCHHWSRVRIFAQGQALKDINNYDVLRDSKAYNMTFAGMVKKCLTICQKNETRELYD